MLTQRVFKGGAWLLGGRIVANIVGLVSTMAVARLLIPEDFGLVAIATSVLGIVQAFVDLPTGTALIQIVDVNDDDYGTAWTLSIIKGLLVCTFMLIAAWPMSILFNDPRLIGLVAGLALYPLITGFRNAYFESFAREMRFDKEVFLDVLSKVASFVAIVVIALVSRSYWALPAGMIASGVAVTVLSFLLRPQLPRITLKSFGRIFHFSAWLTGANIVNNINWQSDPLIVGRLLGKATLGQVSLGSMFVARIDEVTRAPLFRSLFAAFSQIQTDKERLNRAYRSSQAFCVACLWPVGLGIGAVAWPATLLVYGPQWTTAAIVVAFCGPMVALMALVAPSQPLGLALGRGRTLFERDVMALIVRVPLLVAGVLMGQVVGLLIGVLIADIVMVVVNMMMVRLFIGMTMIEQIANVGRSLISGAVMWAAMLPLSRLAPVEGDLLVRIVALGALCGAGAVIYVGLHLVLWKLAGSPEGPETKLFGVAAKVRMKLSRSPG
jgi:PST family polysaccharide transporter